MYYNRQVIHKLDAITGGRPIRLNGLKGTAFHYGDMPELQTHYVYADGRRDYRGRLEIALPKSVKEARALLAEGVIVPAHSLECVRSSIYPWKRRCHNCKEVK